jgi:hypothetical protein
MYRKRTVQLLFRMGLLSVVLGSLAAVLGPQSVWVAWALSSIWVAACMSCCCLSCTPPRATEWMMRPPSAPLAVRGVAHRAQPFEPVQCCICLETVDSVLVLVRGKCGHEFHVSCMEQWSCECLKRGDEAPTCPLDKQVWVQSSFHVSP